MQTSIILGLVLRCDFLQQHCCSKCLFISVVTRSEDCEVVYFTYKVSPHCHEILYCTCFQLLLPNLIISQGVRWHFHVL